MTTMTEQETTEAILEAAAALAETLDLSIETGRPDFYDGQRVLIASSFGIEVGAIKENRGEMRTYRYTEYILNGETMVKETQRITEQGWSETTTISYFLPEDAVTYTGY